jgi:hypothetical protein
MYHHHHHYQLTEQGSSSSFCSAAIFCGLMTFQSGLVSFFWFHLILNTIHHVCTTTTTLNKKIILDGADMFPGKAVK